MTSETPQSPQDERPARGTRIGDVRIRRARRRRISILGRLASRLRGALPR